MVYGLLRALPGVHDLLVTVVRRSSPATLASAKGCQDHTTSPSATSAFVARADCVHRIPRPTLVTIAKRPSCGGGTAQHITDFRFSEGNISCSIWKARDGLIPLGKIAFRRMRFLRDPARSSAASSQGIELIRRFSTVVHVGHHLRRAT